MSKDWIMVRMPRELHEELCAEAKAIHAAYQAGRLDLPPDVIDRIPLHFVIKRLLDHAKDKKARSRAPRRARSEMASRHREATVDASGGGHVYIARPGEIDP
jgi:hypothetical protein